MVCSYTSHSLNPQSLHGGLPSTLKSHIMYLSADTSSLDGADCRTRLHHKESNHVSEEDDELSFHTRLLDLDHHLEGDAHISASPIFTQAVRRAHPRQLAQWALLGGQADKLKSPAGIADGRVYMNVATPLSAFICGSQGSGKSHTLSCFLENYLIKSKAR